MGAVQYHECERARFRVSLSLDGELSELERVSLRAHVGRCAACAAFERDADALTLELRTAPLVPPATAGAGRPASRVALPRRRTAARVLQLSAAAAAVVLAAALGSLAGSLSSRTPSNRTLTAAIGHVGRGDLGVRFPQGLVAMAPAQARTASRTSPSVAL
jgi:predicted anti-sigma-YlaC factor YlaD